jgi:adenosylcobinamide kinase/adenosylcobinamide-phosphate guanylyltransferase
MAKKLGEKVLFVATGQPLDEEMASRIEEHKRIRPRDWRTLEIDVQVGQKLKGQTGDAGIVLLDCLSLLVSNVILPPSLPLSLRAERSNLLALRAGSAKNVEGIDFAEAEKRVVDEIDELIKCIDKHKGIFIVVSNEVGLGLVPDNKLGRVYRDLLGKANQLLAQHADEVYFMASGIPIKIKG